MIVLDYEDFGPQAIANEVIGSEWWQWQSHGDSRPAEYDIKVIVYRYVDFDNVKKQYPVDPEQKKDFRYLEYKNALSYLDEKINENVIEQVTKTLQETREKIIAGLGK